MPSEAVDIEEDRVDVGIYSTGDNVWTVDTVV